ncbi:ROK family protein, partial [bacterium]|nr:ROK family protein [bacterium]
MAIDIGGTRFRVAAVSEVGDLVRVSRRRTNAEGGAEWMIGQVLEIARKYVDRYDIDAIGVGFGGPVRFDQQRIVNS